MARIRICGECRKPVAECICDDDPAEPGNGGVSSSATPPVPRRSRSLSPATRARRGLLPHQCMVTLHVAGSVTTEGDLLDALQRRMPGPGGQTASLKP